MHFFDSADYKHPREAASYQYRRRLSCCYRIFLVEEKGVSC